MPSFIMVLANKGIRIPVDLYRYSAILYRLVLFHIDVVFSHIDNGMTIYSPLSTQKGIECIRTSHFLLNILPCLHRNGIVCDLFSRAFYARSRECYSSDAIFVRERCQVTL
jgi:hypothetical protein